jgi:hypothetical protein
MRHPYLEVTYRRGKPLAAYLYLPRPPGACAAQSSEVRPGIVVDRAADGTPIGVELTNPTAVTADELNAVLAEIGVAAVPPSELAPLRAA